MPAVKRPRASRSFAAAEQSRLTASFPGTQLSMNERLRRGLRIVRGRARDLAINNDHARNFVRVFTRHVVGPNGFSLQVRARNPDGSIDAADSATIEQAFSVWARPGSCDVTGRYSLFDLQTLVTRHLARDGEVLIRRVKPSASAYRYQLQLIDPAMLDETLNEWGPQGWKICMGVELDAWGKPVAYHLKTTVEQQQTGPRLVVPAAEIWHLFLPEDIGQIRGIPPMTAPMLRLNNLGKYEDSAVIAARVGASKAGFFVQQEWAAGDLSGTATVEGASTDSPGEFVQEAEPGVFDVLPPGWDFKSFDPDYPHQNFGEFIKASLKSVAAGLGTAYSTLTGDLTEVNYSSIRAGLLEERQEWMLLQNWLIEAWLQPLYSEWLSMALLSGQLNLPFAKWDKFNQATWQGRRWDWVDPQKDMQAKVLGISAGLLTPSEVIRDTGRDPDTVWQELEQDLSRLRVMLPGYMTQAPQPAQSGKAPVAAPADPAVAANAEADN